MNPKSIGENTGFSRLPPSTEFAIRKGDYNNKKILSNMSRLFTHTLSRTRVEKVRRRDLTLVLFIADCVRDGLDVQSEMPADVHQRKISPNPQKSPLAISINPGGQVIVTF